MGGWRRARQAKARAPCRLRRSAAEAGPTGTGDRLEIAIPGATPPGPGHRGTTAQDRPTAHHRRPAFSCRRPGSRHHRPQRAAKRRFQDAEGRSKAERLQTSTAARSDRRHGAATVERAATTRADNTVYEEIRAARHLKIGIVSTRRALLRGQPTSSARQRRSRRPSGGREQTVTMAKVLKPAESSSRQPTNDLDVDRCGAEYGIESFPGSRGISPDRWFRPHRHSVAFEGEQGGRVMVRGQLHDYEAWRTRSSGPRPTSRTASVQAAHGWTIPVANGR